MKSIYYTVSILSAYITRMSRDVPDGKHLNLSRGEPEGESSAEVLDGDSAWAGGDGVVMNGYMYREVV